MDATITDILDISSRVKAIRQQRGFTQRALDYRAHLSTGYTSKLEGAKIPNPGVLQLRRIAKALHVPLSMIIQDVESDEMDRLPLPAMVNPELEDLTAHLVAIQEADPNRLSALRVIIFDVSKQARVADKEKRARRIARS